MGLSTNIDNENLFINNFHQFHTDEPKSDNGLSYPSILTGFSDLNHQNRILSIPNQKSDPLSWATQNHLSFEPLTTEIPSKYPFLGYSSTNVFEESQNNITNGQKFLMTTFHAGSEATSNILHDFQGNTMWDYNAQNQGFVIGSHEPTLNHIMVGSQPFDMSAPASISKTITGETINRRQDQMMIKTDQKKNKRIMFRRSKPSKKGIIIKGQWTFTEDQILMAMVKRDGAKNWTKIAKLLKGRVGKQCRERWHNHLRPDIKKNHWTEEEDQILIEAHKVLGNKWTEIAQRLPGRSENIVKNHWNATKRRLYSLRAKRSNGGSHRLRNNTLQNYIRSLAINNNHLLMNKEANTKDQNAEIDIVDGVMNLNLNLNLDATTQTAATVVDDAATTTSVYVPEQTAFTWGNDFAELCEPMDDDDTWMLMHGWN